MVEVGAVESARAAVFVEVVVGGDPESGSRRGANGPDERGGSRHQAAPEGQRWLDMLVELRRSLPGLPSLSLDTVVPESPLPQRGRRGRRPRSQKPVTQQTVRDAFAEGKPVARVAHILAGRCGVEDLTPWPVKAVVNAKHLTVPVEERTIGGLTAATMPQLVEAAQRRARNEREVLAPALLLEKQSRVYIESDGARVGRLLADACRSYGVVGPGSDMMLLARNWSTFYWAQAAAYAGGVLVDPDDGHDLYFADGAASHAILAGGPQIGGWDGSVPAPAGVLVALRDPGNLAGGGVLLTWRDAGDHLDVARISLSTLKKRMATTQVNKYVWDVVRVNRTTGVAESYGATAGLNELARLTMILAQAPPTPGVHREPTSDGSPRARPTVIVRYTAKPAGDDDRGAPHTSQSNLDALKWRVRGHYRRQWYPSLGEHRTIWISEHYAERGEDGELVERPVVTKLSQPR